MVYIGIDPGKKGALAAIWENDDVPLVEITPFSEGGYNAALKEIQGCDCICCLERVGPMPGQGVTSMFNFGQNFGFIHGLLTAYSIPYELVTPQRWKKAFGVTAEKNSSIAVCKRLFPGVSLRRTDKCRKDGDGMAEALLMAEYARRKL